MATLSYRKVNRVFPGGQHAVRDLDLEVADGEFVVLVGPSGCGKTTALRMTAGLEDITSGEIAIDGAVVNDVEPQRRDVAMVFQEYALYPQMTVFDNIAFSLKLRKLSRSEITQRVTGMAQTLGIEELLARKPRALSGGQRQRVAMGRALVRDPKVFLMDEPLSNLDAKLRVQMRHEVARIQRDLGTTTVYVTHDQIEAMTMGHRVAVMLDGVLQQVDTPQELYDRPGNMFVAAFIGSPEMNLIRAGLERNDEGEPRFVCHVGGQILPLPVSAARDPAALEAFAGRDIVLGLRPEVFEDAALAAAPVRSHVLRGDTTAVEILGAERLVQIAVPGVAVVTGDLLEGHVEDEAGEPDEPSPRLDSVVVARLAPQSAAGVGAPIDVVVDMAQAHLFDPETGLPI